jgi:hypothetical protein
MLRHNYKGILTAANVMLIIHILGSYQVGTWVSSSPLSSWLISTILFLFLCVFRGYPPSFIYIYIYVHVFP